MSRSRPPCVLSIAGSDSGGGAGIQADLKSFARCGVHGMTAITAITVQNTVAVEAVIPVAPEHVIAQVRALDADIGIDAIKVGMLGSVATIRAVAEALALVGKHTPVVVDPVMVAESGARLLDDDAVGALVELILPRADVLTPNLPEARALAQAGPAASSQDLARALHALGPSVVVVTGGHQEHATDLFFDGERAVPIPGERHHQGAAHGSGCTHSSALAAQLAHGLDALQAARIARALAGEAVRDGLCAVGSGAGPVDVLGVGRRGPRAAGPAPDPPPRLR